MCNTVNGKREIRPRPTAWQSIVLLCGKCAAKFGGAYGPEKQRRTSVRPLRMALNGLNEQEKLAD